MLFLIRELPEKLGTDQGNSAPEQVAGINTETKEIEELDRYIYLFHTVWFHYNSVCLNYIISGPSLTMVWVFFQTIYSHIFFI